MTEYAELSAAIRTIAAVLFRRATRLAMYRVQAELAAFTPSIAPVLPANGSMGFASCAPFASAFDVLWTSSTWSATNEAYSDPTTGNPGRCVSAAGAGVLERAGPGVAARFAASTSGAGRDTDATRVGVC